MLDTENKIAAIGTVTLESKPAIDSARDAYNALSEEDKPKVKNYQTLLDAEAAYTLLLDKAAAEAVDNLIEAIGEVEYTAESKAKIDAARTAYDALTEAQKALATKYDMLTAAENTYAVLADKAAAKAVEDMIAAIPNENELTLDDEAGITAARAAYGALTEAQRAYVPNEAKLAAAEARLAELKALAEKEEADRKAAQSVTDLINALPNPVQLEDKAKVEAARGAYNMLTEDQKPLVAPEALEKLAAAENEIARLEKERDDKAAAAAVENLIANIGEVTLESKPAIDTARNAYNSLTEEQKAFVANYQTLVEAEAAYAHLLDSAAAKAVDEAVAKLAPVTLESKNAIEEARKAFDELTPAQKELLAPETESKLKAAEAEYARLVKEAADKAAAKEVENKIARLQPVTKDSGEAIKDARNSYEALTPEQKNFVSKDALDALVKAEKMFDMIQGSNKPGTLPGGKTDGSSSGVIKISATGTAKGEKNPNTGAPAMSIAPAVLVLAAAALVLKKRG